MADLGSNLWSLLLPILAALFLLGLVVALLAGWARARRQRAGAPVEESRWWSGPSREPAPHRVLRIGLGILWIVDGLLQAQPRMPAGFVPQILDPNIQAGPSWLADLTEPLARVWTHHPITADAATVWVQVGLGILILLGGRGGRLDVLVLWASVVWSLFIWVFGEFFGAILHPGASWLTGSPGAVLVYTLAALLLLAGRGSPAATMGRWCRRTAAGWLLVGAALQAIPWENSWSADGLAAPFRDGSEVAQPAFLLEPIRAMLRLALTHPLLFNGLLVGLLLVTGVGLMLSSARVLLVAAVLICLATWWLAQDFGVLGGYGTDPNTALPLALLLVAGWPRSAADSTAVPVAGRAGGRTWNRTAMPTRAGLTAVGLAALLVIPLLLTISLTRPAGAGAVAADSGGGVLNIPHRPAPDFSLPDQHNHQTSLAGTRGKLTVLTFLDPVCSDDCPVIANQIATAVRQLGPAADQVQVIAIDSNPLFYRISDVAAFTTSHGLDDLPNWHFVAGSEPALRAVLDSYSISVQVPAVGMIAHSEGIYFIDRDGRQVAYLSDGANPQLITSYATVIGDELKKLLK